jgi:uncharacterized protein
MSTSLREGSRSLHPRIKVVWLIGSITRDLVTIAVFSLGAALLDANTDLTLPGWWFVVPVGLFIVLVPLRTWYVGAAYRAWRYRFGDDGLELRRGVFWTHVSSMPYHRLQQVDVGQGPLERWLGMVSVQLRSAAATTDAVIPGIANDEVDELRRLLMQRAGRNDGA